MRQLSTPVQPASGLESVIETVPEPLGPLVVAVIVAVLAKLAVSVSVFEALNLQGLVVPLQVPPDQPVKRLPEFADSVIVIASPESATQVVTFVQPASELESVIVAVPLPLVAVVIVYVVEKLAVSVSVFEALNLQGLVVPLQLPPPDQPVKRLPEFADSVIVIASPESATQVVTFVQPASELESLIVAVPLPLVVVVIV
jgi:hypothetical protein